MMRLQGEAISQVERAGPVGTSNVEENAGCTVRQASNLKLPT